MKDISKNCEHPFLRPIDKLERKSMAYKDLDLGNCIQCHETMKITKDYDPIPAFIGKGQLYYIPKEKRK